MVLRMKHIACFKANWQPKSENIRQIAAELNLGLDSFVFIDDNPAEVEIVRQFVPEVETILLSPDPSEYVAQLQDSRFFEPGALTEEDLLRVEQYRQESERRGLLESVTDMRAYLESLNMQAQVHTFRPVDVPRIAQLINKSNQFNLTTRRRTEAEVQAVMNDPDYFAFTVRLADRFGDYGLISVIICNVQGGEAEIDTWLMSCRVLKREVEHLVLNEIVQRSRARKCERIRGVYLPTTKNGMVREHYPALGFQTAAAAGDRLEFVLSVPDYRDEKTSITVNRDAYDTD
jgi:FkbH-like protein